MNDFAKTKIAFTVALLAALYTINPLLLKFGSIGIQIFEFSISIKFVYYLMLGCLGMSVYFYSVQFISEKKIGYVQETGDILYGIALSLPPVFLSLILAIKAINLIGKDELTYFTSPLLGVFAGVLASFLSAKFKSKISKMRRSSEAKNEEKLKHQYLTRAKKLFDDGYFDLSILETFKAIESALNRQLLSLGVELESGNFFSNFKNAKRLEILRSSDVQTIENLRKIRNQVAHNKVQITEDEAKNLLKDGEKVIISISMAGPTAPQTGIPSFDWLMENYSNAIDILKGVKSGNLSDIIQRSVDAWNHRDGSIGTEISSFFAEALLHSPKNLIYELRSVDDFDEWLNFMTRNILTDWGGNEEKSLIKLQKSIIESIQIYTRSEKNKKRLYIAQQILEGFKGSEVSKIY